MTTMTRDEFDAKTYHDDNNIVRWKSNDTVPFISTLEEMGFHGRVLEAHKEARASDLDETIEKMRGRERTPEEMFEMRAAFGEGEEFVNVLTGETFRT